MENLKNKIYNLIRDDDYDSNMNALVDGLIIILILINVALTILDTFDDLPIYYYELSSNIEIVLTIAFTIEYILRLWTATLIFKNLNPTKARIKFALRPTSIIDLISILPFYLPMVLPADLRILRLLRLVRLFRIFKVSRYTDAIYIISEVLHRKKAQLISSLFTIAILIIISSVLMFGLESTSQPLVFKNALDGFWWVVSTLTSANYGEIYPITIIGKLLAAVISLLGIGLIAVPTGIISAGFVEVITHTPDTTSEEAKINMLREYKKLLDDGIISTDEYNQKKTKLLE